MPIHPQPLQANALQPALSRLLKRTGVTADETQGVTRPFSTSVLEQRRGRSALTRHWQPLHGSYIRGHWQRERETWGSPCIESLLSPSLHWVHLFWAPLWLETTGIIRYGARKLGDPASPILLHNWVNAQAPVSAESCANHANILTHIVEAQKAQEWVYNHPAQPLQDPAWGQHADSKTYHSKLLLPPSPHRWGIPSSLFPHSAEDSTPTQLQDLKELRDQWFSTMPWRTHLIQQEIKHHLT